MEMGCALLVLVSLVVGTNPRVVYWKRPNQCPKHGSDATVAISGGWCSRPLPPCFASTHTNNCLSGHTNPLPFKGGI